MPGFPPPWSEYLVMALGFIGVWVAVRGAVSALSGILTPRQSRHQLAARVRGLRRFIVGLAVTGLAVGWLTDSLWLIVLSLIFLGEEVLETSVILLAMTWRERTPA